MFASKDWLKETLVLIALIIVVSTLVAMFIPFPYSLPVTIIVVILTVWLIHRRSRYVPLFIKGLNFWNSILHP